MMVSTNDGKWPEEGCGKSSVASMDPGVAGDPVMVLMAHSSFQHSDRGSNGWASDPPL